MSEKIESYNASYPLAYYDIGTVYSFYGRPILTGKYASAEYIRKYSAMLLSLTEREKNNAIKPVSSSSKSNSKHLLERYYAVVVDKINNKTPKIEVMFIANNDGHYEYLLRSYIVSKGCATDGIDLMPVSSTASGKNLKENAGSKTGGITLDEPSGRRGGITLDEGTRSKIKGVGGITLDETPEKAEKKTASSTTKKSGTSHSNITGAVNKKHVGGITLDED